MSACDRCGDTYETDLYCTTCGDVAHGGHGDDHAEDAAELESILDACDAIGWYEPSGRDYDAGAEGENALNKLRAALPPRWEACLAEPDDDQDIVIKWLGAERAEDDQDICGRCWAIASHIHGEISCAGGCECLRDHEDVARQVEWDAETPQDAEAAIQRAIDRSESHDQIVTIDWSPEREAALLAECDDYTDANGVLEAWANGDSDDMAWRVHLRGERTGVES